MLNLGESAILFLIVPHLEDLRYICLDLEAQSYDMNFSVCNVWLKIPLFHIIQRVFQDKSDKYVNPGKYT